MMRAASTDTAVAMILDAPRCGLGATALQTDTDSGK